MVRATNPTMVSRTKSSAAATEALRDSAEEIAAANRIAKSSRASSRRCSERIVLQRKFDNTARASHIVRTGD
jgi:hypothetical protein